MLCLVTNDSISLRRTPVICAYNCPNAGQIKHVSSGDLKIHQSTEGLLDPQSHHGHLFTKRGARLTSELFEHRTTGRTDLSKEV